MINVQKERLRVVGLTGGIGSGKTAASDCFAALGIEVVDADQVARQVVEPGSPALAAIHEHFGDRAVQDDGTLDRSALREIIFHDKAEKHWLEALLHPLIRAEIERQLHGSRSAYSLLVSPLLLETGQDALVDRVLLIDVPEALQLARTRERDQSSEETVRAIMDSQMSREQRRERADDIIVNDGDLAQLQSRVREMHEQYCEAARCPDPD